MSLTIPTNDTKPYSVVSECYELLRATTKQTNTEQYFKNQWLLYRASSNAPLREARVRSFKPLKRNEPYHIVPTGEISIIPYVLDYDPDYRYTMSETNPNYHLYNAIINSQSVGDVELPITKQTYTFNLNASLKTTKDGINSLLKSYFQQFADEGTFDFSDGTNHNFITNYNQGIDNTLGILTSYSPPAGYTISYMKPLRNGLFVYEMTNDGGTTSTFAISKPADLASKTSNDMYKIEVAPAEILDCATNKPDARERTVIITASQMVVIDSNLHQVRNIAAPNNKVYKEVACNDREFIITIRTQYSPIEQTTCLLSDYTLITVNNEIITSAICGFNDKFIYAVSFGANLKIYITNKTFEPDETVEIITEWTPSNFDEINHFDVINGINKIYFVGWDKSHYNFYFFEATTTYDRNTDKWTTTYKYNGTVHSSAYNNTFATHLQGSFLYCRHYSGYCQLWGFNNEGDPFAQKIAKADIQTPDLELSGGWDECIAANTTKYIEIGKERENNTILTVSDYLTMFSEAMTQIDIVKLHYDEEDDKLFGHCLMIPLTRKLLMFNIEIDTAPYSLISTRTMSELQDNILQLDDTGTYLNTDNDYITTPDDYEDQFNNLAQIGGNYYINLCSPHMNNISHIIYNTYTEANVVFKTIDSLPSANYLTIYLTEPNGTIPTIEELKNNYNAIYVEIDYIYERV